MKLYEIVNPSDRVIVAACDDLTAAVAVLLLGSGQYGLRDEAGETVLPIFLFANEEDLTKWLEPRGVPNLGAWIKEHAAPLADVFESAFYGTATELRAIDAAVAGIGHEAALAARRRYNDTKRSSMNNIGAACEYWAKRCREVAETP